MKWIIKHFDSGTHAALSVTAVLCFIQFLSGIFCAFRDGVFNSTVLNQLLASADGFETVVLFIIVMALKNKKK